MRKILRTILFVAMVMACSLTAMATENVRNDNTPYVFPIVPGSSEWESFGTKQEMVDVCQIPVEKLNNMTTEALLETVFNYPLLLDYMLFDSYEDAFNVMSRDFNGFNELLAREDVTEVILEKYSKTNVVTAMMAEEVEPKEFFASTTMEYLIVCDEMKNGEFSIDEKKKIEEVHDEKMEDRSESGIYSRWSEVYLNYKMEDMLLTRAGEVKTQVSDGTVKTPRGSNVTRVYTCSPELTAIEKGYLMLDSAAKYPRAVRIAEPTVRYNCHSYAWYSRSTSNPYWIEFPMIYMTDGSYRSYSGTPIPGMKGWYYYGEHSAISLGNRTENGSQVHYVESKWGQDGVYQHPYNYCPYTPSVEWYVAN